MDYFLKEKPIDKLYYKCSPIITKYYGISKAYLLEQFTCINSYANKGITYYETHISYNPATEKLRHQLLYLIALPIAIIFGVALRKPSYLLKYLPIGFITCAYFLQPDSLNPFQKNNQIK